MARPADTVKSRYSVGANMNVIPDRPKQARAATHSVEVTL